MQYSTNPAKGKFSVEIVQYESVQSGPAAYSVALPNKIGGMVYTAKTTALCFDINTWSFEKGLYYLIIESNEEQHVMN